MEIPICEKHGPMRCYINHYIGAHYDDNYGGITPDIPEHWENCSYYCCDKCGDRRMGKRLPDYIFIPDCLRR